MRHLRLQHRERVELALDPLQLQPQHLVVVGQLLGQALRLGHVRLLLLLGRRLGGLELHLQVEDLLVLETDGIPQELDQRQLLVHVPCEGAGRHGRRLFSLQQTEQIPRHRKAAGGRRPAAGARTMLLRGLLLQDLDRVRRAADGARRD
eukprot:SAG22_NODE_3647_length_1597_cov_1.019359_1_plen_148_part_10